MKKTLILVLAMLVITGIAMAQSNIPFVAGAWSTTVPGGVTAPPKGFTIDKLGGHQNGGRGCVGCHAPHSGARGNGGGYSWNAGTSTYVSTAVTGISGDEVLWGQDLGPIYANAAGFTFPVNADYPVGSDGKVVLSATTSPERQITGIAMCLSCHDGNVAKGAMMANKSFEQAAGMLPAGVYGAQDIPTLLGADGGSYGNYENDHPVGPQATLGIVGHGAINSTKGFFATGLSSGTPVIVKGPNFAGSQMDEFYKNYGLYMSVDARAGAGWVLDSAASTLDSAYVVCTTCHTPHSMYTTSAKLGGVSKGTVPTFFFLAAPYNPGANVASGTKASSATQFCRQCHFSGPGGANEASGISIPTAF
jgi:cytochrome c553